MNQMTRFVAPNPNFTLMRILDWVNRTLMLKGVIGLRDLPVLNRLAGLRGITNVRHIEFPAADQERLRRSTRAGTACFVTPNHPEFFTDWMIDKEIASRFFPTAAFWATNAIVNGLGRTIQKFWLANNLIAQIPGNSAPAREHSIAYVLAGNVVLLHPEGQVGWHRDRVAPLMAGAAEMALETVRRYRERGEQREVWLAPVVWKLTFTEDVSAALARECAYVERRLGVAAKPEADLAQRVYALYACLLERDEAALGLASSSCESFSRRHNRRVETLVALLAKAAGMNAERGADAVLRAVRKRLRAAGDPGLKKQADMLQKALRIGDFARAKATIAQEDIAEHLKRLRADHCFGSWRDTLNRFVPQPVGPRVAHISVPEPMAMHHFEGSAAEAMTELRRRMQAALDDIHDEASGSVTGANPFR